MVVRLFATQHGAFTTGVSVGESVTGIVDYWNPYKSGTSSNSEGLFWNKLRQRRGEFQQLSLN